MKIKFNHYPNGNLLGMGKSEILTGLVIGCFSSTYESSKTKVWVDGIVYNINDKDILGVIE